MELSVAAITSGPVVPSARFRVRQYIPALRAHGVLVDEFTPFISKYASWSDLAPSTPAPLRFIVSRVTSMLKIASRAPGVVGARRHDLCWLEREMLPGRLTFERLLPSPLVFDVDDAIWLSSEKASRAVNSIAKRSAVVMAGNEDLSKHLSNVAQRVEVVPTGVDTAYFSPRDREPGRLRLGWMGTSSNFPFLEDIEPVLCEFLERHDAELMVVSDRKPNLPSLGARLAFVRWRESIEVESTCRFDIGLMPLRDDEWTRGKCALKLLQYMACGVPAVASPVGVARRILAEGGGLAAKSPSDWMEALSILANNETRRSSISRSGREAVIRNYSHEVIVPRIAAIFGSVAK